MISQFNPNVVHYLDVYCWFCATSREGLLIYFCIVHRYNLTQPRH